MIMGLDGPSPACSAATVRFRSEKGAGCCCLFSCNRPGTKTITIVRAERQPDHVTRARNSSYLCQKRNPFFLEV